MRSSPPLPDRLAFMSGPRALIAACYSAACAPHNGGGSLPGGKQGGQTVALHLTKTASGLMQSISDAGGRPLVVGGAVRDAFTGHPSKDVDIEAHGITADALHTALLATGHKVDAVGKSFGVLKVTAANGEDFDVSLPRIESKTTTGHKGFEIKVDPNLTVEQAFARRDFAINAMGADQAGNLIDPFGGAQDLRNGVLRHTSAAFAEDPLRVLRGMQFAGRMGLTMHPATAELARSLKSERPTIATERIWTEFEKMASKATEPSRSLQVLRETGWDEFFPAIAHGDGAAADRAAKTTKTGDAKTSLVLASVLHASHNPSEALQGIGATLAVSKAVRGYTGLTAPSQATVAAARTAARTLEKSGLTLRDWIEFKNATSGADAAASWTRAATEAGVLDAPATKLVTGATLQARGMRPGPEMGKLLTRATEATDAGDLTAGTVQSWLDANSPTNA